MSQVLIDGRFVGVGESVSRYTLEILSRILRSDKDNEYTLLIRPVGEKKLADYPIIKSAANCKIETLDIPHYSPVEQTKLLKYLNEKKFDLVHFTQFNHPIFYKGNFVVTVHDLTMLGHLHRQNPLKRMAFNKVMKAAALNSTKIITVSETSKNDILDYYDIPANKIVVTYLGVDAKYNLKVKNETEKIDAFKEKYKIEDQYILYTGMWKRHKNLLRALEAYEIAAKKGEIGNRNIQFVMAGKVDENEEEVIDKIKEINDSLGRKAVVATGFVLEEELPIAYAGASVYIIPSLSEGFGLPPLEAMACGTPVISSKESCMPEILGDAPLYFDPYNINEMAEVMEKVITDKDLRQSMIPKGLEQVRKYSWDDTAEKTLAVYKQTLKLN